MPRVIVPQEWVSKLSKEQQINELNSEIKCTVAPSKIHGVGVVALVDIKKGERVYCLPRIQPRFYNVPFGSLNKLFPEVKELILSRWASIVNGSVFTNPNDIGLIFFMNHSYDDYNYDVATDCAIIDIPADAEVLENYCYMENAEKAYPWLKCNKNNNFDSPVGSGEGVVAHPNQLESRQPLCLFKRVISRFTQKNQKKE